jgi:hypothetical protein
VDEGANDFAKIFFYLYPPMKSRKPTYPPPSTSFDPEFVTNPMDFDSLEEKIRGDEIMGNEEYKKIKEERERKKKLDENEVDQRLEELKKKIKPKK